MVDRLPVRGRLPRGSPAARRLVSRVRPSSRGPAPRPAGHPAGRRRGVAAEFWGGVLAWRRSRSRPPWPPVEVAGSAAVRSRSTSASSSSSRLPARRTRASWSATCVRWPRPSGRPASTSPGTRSSPATTGSTRPTRSATDWSSSNRPGDLSDGGAASSWRRVPSSRPPSGSASAPSCAARGAPTGPGSSARCVPGRCRRTARAGGPRRRPATPVRPGSRAARHRHGSHVLALVQPGHRLGQEHDPGPRRDGLDGDLRLEVLEHELVRQVRRFQLVELGERVVLGQHHDLHLGPQRDEVQALPVRRQPDEAHRARPSRSTAVCSASSTRNTSSWLSRKRSANGVPTCRG